MKPTRSDTEGLAEKDYVLGTHDAEIERLGLQHRVWRPHATDAWRRAGFRPGQTLLDVGCGPGYATLDLAEIVGPAGRVIAVDRSRRFLNALEAGARVRGIANIAVHELDLDVEPPPDVPVDGAWSRWVYSFVKEPRVLLARVASALRSGGVMALHEYVDYRAWRLSPRSPEFDAFVIEVMASWRENGGEPDIGLELPLWLEDLDFEISEIRPIVEVARRGDYLWEWPRAFIQTGLSRLTELGRIDSDRAKATWQAFLDREETPGAFMINPTVLEVIARKR